ncbi:MAG: cytochrome c oxidase assembly protein [Anaerolineales bacterium]
MFRLPLRAHRWGFLGWILAAGLFVALTPPAFAHPGPPFVPFDPWHHWNGDPTPWLILGVTLWITGRGWQRYAGRGHSATLWRRAAFIAGILVLFIALISPLDALAEQLFAAHMVQHMLMVVVAAPLLTASRPLTFMLLGLPSQLRHNLGRLWNRSRRLQMIWRGISRPAVTWSAHTLALWAWHAPGLYEPALSDVRLHALEHLSFLLTALLFWWAIIQMARQSRENIGAAILYLFTMAIQSGLLGVLMTFARQPWYTVHTLTAPQWGLSALDDQQLAGVIMWVPAGLVYVLTALLLFRFWLEDMEHRAGRLPANSWSHAPAVSMTEEVIAH